MKIDGIICGHLHIARQLSFYGIPVYISHTAGQKNRDKEHPAYGYMVLDFKSDGSITVNYVFKPELKRSRNFFYGFVLENVHGNSKWFIWSAVLFSTGLLFILIRRKNKA